MRVHDILQPKICRIGPLLEVWRIFVTLRKNDLVPTDFRDISLDFSVSLRSDKCTVHRVGQSMSISLTVPRSRKVQFEKPNFQVDLSEHRFFDYVAR